MHYIEILKFRSVLLFTKESLNYLLHDFRLSFVLFGVSITELRLLDSLALKGIKADLCLSNIKLDCMYAVFQQLPHSIIAFQELNV